MIQCATYSKPNLPDTCARHIVPWIIKWNIQNFENRKEISALHCIAEKAQILNKTPWILFIEYHGNAAQKVPNWFKVLNFKLFQTVRTNLILLKFGRTFLVVSLVVETGLSLALNFLLSNSASLINFLSLVRSLFNETFEKQVTFLPV